MVTFAEFSREWKDIGGPIIPPFLFLSLFIKLAFYFQNKFEIVSYSSTVVAMSKSRTPHLPGALERKHLLNFLDTTFITSFAAHSVARRKDTILQ